MFSVREVPWHKLGVVLDAPPTSKEAIRLAGLDWKVDLKQVNFFNKEGSPVVVDGSFVTVRNDAEFGELPLGVVGSKYTPLQNDEAFDFFDPIIANKIAEYETAGSLFGGAKVWILAKIGADVEVGEGDKVVKYVLLSNSHDGSSTTVGKITPVRVVCNNTLSAALRESTNVRNQFSIRHTKSIKEKLKQAETALEVVQSAYEKLEKVWRKMSEISLPPTAKFAFVKEVFPSKEDSKNDKRLQTLRAEILSLMSNGAGMSLNTAHDTLWGAYNAVTEHVTHSISERKNSSLETHVNNLWSGRLSDINDRAFAAAVKYMKEQGVEVDSL
jgi:phage/plasmid-like protein (TIGR03299 family)